MTAHSFNKSSQSFLFNKKDAVEAKSSCFMSMSKMLPRSTNWVNNLHEARFAFNFDKMPRVCSNVKKGELVDSQGSLHAHRDLDMRKTISRKDEGPFGSAGKSFGQSNLDYDVNYDSVHANCHKEYQSQFLKRVNKQGIEDKGVFDRFADSCQYKTIKKYGANTSSTLAKPCGRPGTYNLISCVPAVSVVNEDNKVSSLDARKNKAPTFEIEKQIERSPRRKFYNEYIVQKEG